MAKKIGMKNPQPKVRSASVIELVIGTIAVMVIWRGVWQILDKYLSPSYFLLGQLTPFVAGILILFILARKRNGAGILESVIGHELGPHD